MEYGVIGLSEEVAIERLGQDNVEVYHVHWKPLKWSVIMDKDTSVLPYCKLVCDKTRKCICLNFHNLALLLFLGKYFFRSF